MFDLVFFSERISDLKAIAETESRLGNNTVILAKNFHSEKELNELKEKIKGINFKFKLCHLITAPEPKELNKFKGKALVAVLGGNVTLNKFAVSTKGIDFLLQPCNEGQLSFDTAIAQTAADNGIPIAFAFSQFLEMEGVRRRALFRNYSFTSRLIRKFKLECMMFSGAKGLGQMRSIKDLTSVLVLLGFTREQAERLAERSALELFTQREQYVYKK
ncbi:MAG: RNase P subunit p30 family protein [Candidatus Diapherotrites archaeon]